MSTNAKLAADELGLNIRKGLGYRLRPLCYDDAEALFGILSASQEATWQRIPGTREYTESLLRFRLRSYEEYGLGVLAVESDTGVLLGQAGLQVFSPDPNESAPRTRKGAAVGGVLDAMLYR